MEDDNKDELFEITDKNYQKISKSLEKVKLFCLFTGLL